MTLPGPRPSPPHHLLLPRDNLIFLKIVSLLQFFHFSSRSYVGLFLNFTEIKWYCMYSFMTCFCLSTMCLCIKTTMYLSTLPLQELLVVSSLEPLWTILCELSVHVTCCTWVGISQGRGQWQKSITHSPTWTHCWYGLWAKNGFYVLNERWEKEENYLMTCKNNIKFIFQYS